MALETRITIKNKQHQRAIKAVRHRNSYMVDTQKNREADAKASRKSASEKHIAEAKRIISEARERIIISESETKHKPMGMTYQGSNLQGVTSKKVDHYSEDHEAHEIHHNGELVGKISSYDTTLGNVKKNSIKRVNTGQTKTRWRYEHKTSNQPGGYGNTGNHFTSKKIAAEELMGHHLRHHTKKED